MGLRPRHDAARRASGFTLIEIVVVIVILAILIAMAAALTRGVAAPRSVRLRPRAWPLWMPRLVQFVMQQKRLPCPGGWDAAVLQRQCRRRGCAHRGRLQSHHANEWRRSLASSGHVGGRRD
jgi:prepilin-type N-terminal cleavage/methylation domain-containing protein